MIAYASHHNADPHLIAARAGFGAYHAVNLALRNPWHVNRVIGMSGVCDIKRQTGGCSDQHVYFHDPSHFLIHESEHTRLEQLRRLDIVLAIGRDDPACPDDEHLSEVLWSKGVWHALRIWDGRADDRPSWRQMIVRYVGGTTERQCKGQGSKCEVVVAEHLELATMSFEILRGG